MKHTQVDATSASAFFAVASLDWYMAAPPDITLYTAADPPSIARRIELVDEGLQYADKALALDADYADAMKFKSLLLIEKARLSEDPEDQFRYMTESRDWGDKANAARERNAEKNRTAGGIIADK
jgi:hypothetical protein